MKGKSGSNNLIQCTQIAEDYQLIFNSKITKEFWKPLLSNKIYKENTKEFFLTSI